MESFPLSTATARPHLAALSVAFETFAAATTPALALEALLDEAVSLLAGSGGAIVDAREVRAARAVELAPESAFAGATNVPRPVTIEGRAYAAWRFAPAPEEALALLVADAALTPERAHALMLLGAYASSRVQYLRVRDEVNEAREQAKAAHEQQMEMALRLYDLYEEAQNQAITDGLTGLHTHAYFQQRLAQEMSASVRYQQPLSFMIFDLDHFKSINDTHGHQAGDIVLKETAAMLQAKVRTSDLVARYGGEEFAIILPQTPEEDAYLLAERLRVDLAEIAFDIGNGRKLKVTASIGLASRIEADANQKDLIKRADVALYAAKNRGRNRVVRAEGPASEAMNAIGAPRQGSQEMFLALARALSAAIEARIPTLYGHSEAVGELAQRVAKALGLPTDKQEALLIAGMLHDLGMLAVPESVILKPSALDPEEWDKMKSHPQAGVAILSRFSSFAGLREAVLYHHERWDGQGYPEGLQGEAISVGARILAICDSYDAMIRGEYTDGKGIPSEEAIAEIRRCAGTQFDPNLVEVFLGVLAEEPPQEG
ncbi:MAG TPA: diguanylate cyclase [Oscillatoriaceae cyanobacterium]